jgi:hypothetical protein
MHRIVSDAQYSTRLLMYSSNLSRACVPRSYPFGTEVAIMGTALTAWMITVLIYYSRTRRRFLRLAARGTMTVALVLYPTAVFSAVGLLHCRSVVMTPNALMTLNGGGGVNSDGAPTVSASVLVSNSFFVCWVYGGAQRPAAIFACITLVLFGAAFPPVTLWWIRRDAWLAVELAHRKITKVLTASGRSLKLPPAVTSEAANNATPITADASLASPAPSEPSVDLDQLIVPLFDDYHPGAWYFKFFDLLLVAVLATTEAMLPRPASLEDIVAKAVLICIPSLSMAAFVFIVRPFPPVASWQTWVRIGLLFISMGCAVLNAVATSFDLRLGPSSLSGVVLIGSYALFVGCCIISLQLAVGFVAALVWAARNEKKLMYNCNPTVVKASDDVVFVAPTSALQSTDGGGRGNAASERNIPEAVWSHPPQFIAPSHAVDVKCENENAADTHAVNRDATTAAVSPTWRPPSRPASQPFASGRTIVSSRSSR